MSSRDIRVIGLLGVVHGTSHYYQLAFVTMLLIVRERAGLGFEDIGVLGGLFYAVSGIAQTVAGFAVDRHGARPILAGGLAVLGLSLGLIAVADSMAGFAIIAVLGGLGNAVFHPADFALINASVNPDRLGRAYSIHGLGGSLGWAAAPAMYFLDAMFGWVGAAVLGAIPGLALAAIVWGSGAALIDHRVKEQVTANTRQQGTSLALFLQPPILICLLYFALVAASTVGIQQFAVPAWHSMFGVSESYAALCLIVFVVGAAAGMLVGGVFADRMRHHERIAALGMIASAAFTLPIALQSITPEFLMPLLALAGFSGGITNPSRDMIVRSVTPPGASGKVFGFVYSGLDIGSFLAPPLFGILMSHGVPAIMFWVAVGLYLMNAMLVTIIRQTAKAVAVPAAAE